MNAGEKYQKIRDGSIEKHFSKTFDQVNALNKEESESSFFTQPVNAREIPKIV